MRKRHEQEEAGGCCAPGAKMISVLIRILVYDIQVHRVPLYYLCVHGVVD